MAKIDRYNGNMAAFAADALSTERTIFGDTTQSDTLDANITADFLRGWGVVGVNENPTKQDFKKCERSVPGRRSWVIYSIGH